MAIYMDLHQISGASPQDLAEAHKKDLELQDEFGVKMLTYWYDNERGTAFAQHIITMRSQVRKLVALARSRHAADGTGQLTGRGPRANSWTSEPRPLVAQCRPMAAKTLPLT